MIFFLFSLSWQSALNVIMHCRYQIHYSLGLIFKLSSIMSCWTIWATSLTEFWVLLPNLQVGWTLWSSFSWNCCWLSVSMSQIFKITYYIYEDWVYISWELLTINCPLSPYLLFSLLPLLLFFTNRHLIRVLTLSCKGQGYNSIIPTVPEDVTGDSHELTKSLADKVTANVEQYIEAMEKVANAAFEIAWYCAAWLIVF